jgi:hypothetical protein
MLRNPWSDHSPHDLAEHKYTGERARTQSCPHTILVAKVKLLLSKRL